ncbi:MAG: [FeFe] hydrogenase H-cluster radical SAM maturase HydE [Lentisphaerae bacterium]|nr:[FeFe] hydrogenase H-cluster radical SAM maturase HydE [Lentisphaerota bacterium]MCP4100518.1 [FeFe] hydrogenase H-cluster radical SAM maturase HydE [Lentisphaerota bacterium]
MSGLFEKINLGSKLEKQDLIDILNITEQNDLEKLFKAAYQVKLKYIGKRVSLRGIVEISNKCVKDCLYCGIRNSNRNVERFELSKQQIVDGLLTAYSFDYGSAVMQGGERTDEKFIIMIESVLHEVKERTNGRLGITLSLGEQDEEVYQRWFDAGAHRYLLRIEASNPELYKKMHPSDHKHERRMECLHSLQNVGYQTGTGVLIGVPGQTIEDLANDLMFFKEFDIDMIGMGPYLVHPDTPMAKEFPGFEQKRKEQLNLGLKMIAAARLLLNDVNIASTTALQALDPLGRELGLLAGGNVIMPNVTATEYRKGYQLYSGKPGLDENSEQSRLALEKSIAQAGETIIYNDWGDSLHYFKRCGKE